MNIRITLPVLLLIILSLSYCSGDKNKKTGQTDVQSETESNQIDEDIVRARTMGLAYLEEGDLEAAETEFRKLIELAPQEAIGYANMGVVYLRMGRYKEAETLLKKAIDLDPEDPDIMLNLARVYEYSDKAEKSVKTLEKSIEIAPDHVQTLYSLAESYSGSPDKSSMELWEKYMQKVVDASPANIVPRLHLTEILLRSNKPDQALYQMEEIARLFPEFHEEARQYYDQAIMALQTGKPDEALTDVLIFHNLLKLTNPYQQGIAELKGYSGSVGVPVLTFSEAASVYMKEGETILDALRFKDVTASAGLANLGSSPVSHVALGDMDHDGDADIYLSTRMTGEEDSRKFLLKCEMGSFTDVANEAGIIHTGRDNHASFTDFDNDGYLDLYITGESGGILYKSVSEGKYEDVSKKAGTGKITRGNKSLFFDMDHEGDLDLFTATSGSNSLLRNNGNGTFQDKSDAAGLGSPMGNSRDVCFGDFDEDGDIDLFVLNENTGSVLYDNLREGKFRDISTETGLSVSGISVACGDYNNDGYLDLLIAENSDGVCNLYRNSGTGSFQKDPAFDSVSMGLKNLLCQDLEFFDFDNDGYLDILLAGISEIPGESGLKLLHNSGRGIFKDMSKLLPDSAIDASRIAFADYNNDGDMDIFLAGARGGLRLLRNDGGNANHRLKMQLVGIRTGSGKNNHFGIGSKIEVRAGELYQMKVVTEPTIHFGLADNSAADVVRIQWTNGTPQNIFSPGADQDMIEEQQLKGSCPFLYAWNGTAYAFVKDVMWRSALGMPLGIMGETTGFTYAFADASVDYHKIPGESLKPKKGKYSIQITEELWETIYFDEIELIVLDHPDNTEVFVDEKFTPPPYPEHRVYKVSSQITPVSAVDGHGNELRDRIAEKDNLYISNFKRTAYQGITDMRELILDPGLSSDSLFLFLNGWIFPTDASINVAISQSENIKPTAPYLQVINGQGKWETVINDIGFPEGKNKTVVVDLRGKFLSGDHRVRICTNMEIYWDHIFLAADRENVTVRTNRLKPSAANHHYRGYSRLYRKGSRYGPHWFDYETVSNSPKWRDLTGTYTRFGDVKDLLQESDDRYIIANSGEETTIEFDASSLPELSEGWKRDFLIYSVGWVKDGDMNTSTGQVVEPLPFHGMSKYPYGMEEAYPDDSRHRDFLRSYITRQVTNKKFLMDIRKKSIEER